MAIANGFVGTESEWLISLEGADGSPGVAGTVSAASGVTLSQVATPIEPDPGEKILYSKLDGNIYIFAEGGAEQEIAIAGKITATITANYTANNREVIPCDTSSGTFDITTPTVGKFKVVDIIGDSPTTGFGVSGKNLRVVGASGYTVHGQTAPDALVLSVGAISPEFTLFGTDWRITNHG